MDPVLTCKVALDSAGQCPEGQTAWVVPATPWDMPNVEQLRATFDMSVNVFLMTTLFVCLFAWAVRLMLDEVH